MTEEIWQKIEERDDCFISDSNRVKIVKETLQTGDAIHYTDNGHRRTIAANLLIAQYCPKPKMDKPEVWAETDTPNIYVSSHQCIKTVVEKITTPRCIKVDSRQINVTTLVAKYFPDDEQDEEWRDIPGFSRYLLSSESRIKNKKTHKILKQFERNDHLQIGLIGDDGKEDFMRVYRLMRKVFGS
uniref:NUMOD4 domain-containing protein n=1 Tax=viral metagenome TaxID=1070528 RepID=A0A6C0JUA2_9ZZZZ